MSLYLPEKRPLTPHFKAAILQHTHRARIYLFVLMTSLALGCYESVLIAPDDTPGTALHTDEWPPEECTYQLNVTEEADGLAEALVFVPADDVEGYYIRFSEGLESVVTYGPSFLDADTRIFSDESPLQPGGNGEKLVYFL